MSLKRAMLKPSQISDLKFQISNFDWRHPSTSESLNLKFAYPQKGVCTACAALSPRLSGRTIVNQKPLTNDENAIIERVLWYKTKAL